MIYDPNGGFVTGGGWINSPEGAYVPDPSLTGKANFGFVAKYQKGKSVPQGNTEFQFKAGNLNFKSTDYEFLIVAGTKAMFKGTGTINGNGSYQFILSAKDEDPDTFRIKITDGNDLVYDNQSTVPDNEYPDFAIAGGSIMVHEGGKKGKKDVGTNEKSKPQEDSDSDQFEGFELVSYPNPSTSDFKLKLKSGNSIDKVEISIYDLNGRQVYYQLGNANQEYRIGSSFQAGLYIVNVVQAEEFLQTKLIKY